MSLSEFDIIEQFFRRPPRRNDVVLGIGDDAALLEVPQGQLLVSAVDTLVAGRHFPPQADPFDIGYKSLAVNLSDLAAMGAMPAWATLALTLPQATDDWLEAFAGGFFGLAREHGVELVGGDTTRGPLSVSVQLQGFVEPQRVLRRAGARPGQAILVSGTPGDAAWALKQWQAGQAVDPLLLQRLNRPQPRVALGRSLGGVATAAIDVSDGLLADLGHLLAASGCAATLWIERLPRSAALAVHAFDDTLAYQLGGGDDYELCFTVDFSRLDEVAELARQAGTTVTEIGRVEEGTGIRCLHEDGRRYRPERVGFDHFGPQEAP
ncbi:MAG TPA: thiamine-phosphate kinase [Gammaproteobacteria bacterium]|nr:thiamine-phosphate kinase [Gammaproteobacteria bacterium]